MNLSKYQLEIEILQIDLQSAIKKCFYSQAADIELKINEFNKLIKGIENAKDITPNSIEQNLYIYYKNEYETIIKTHQTLLDNFIVNCLTITNELTKEGVTRYRISFDKQYGHYPCLLIDSISINSPIQCKVRTLPELFKTQLNELYDLIANSNINNLYYYLSYIKKIIHHPIELTINKNGYPCFCHVYIDMQSINTKIYGVKEPSLILHLSKNQK